MSIASHNPPQRFARNCSYGQYVAVFKSEQAVFSGPVPYMINTQYCSIPRSPQSRGSVRLHYCTSDWLCLHLCYHCSYNWRHCFHTSIASTAVITFTPSTVQLSVTSSSTLIRLQLLFLLSVLLLVRRRPTQNYILEFD